MALVLVGLNGFFVAAEFALVRVRESRIVQLEQEGSARAGVVRETLRDLDSNLSVCQVGITVASLALGWVGEPAVSHLIEPVLASFGVGSDQVVTVVSVIIGFGVITYAHLVFGEQAPKYYSIQRAERVALWISRPLNLFRLVLRPVVWVVNASTNFILRPWGIRLGEAMEAHSEEELRIMITSSTASGRASCPRASPCSPPWTRPTGCSSPWTTRMPSVEACAAPPTPCGPSSSAPGAI